VHSSFILQIFTWIRRKITNWIVCTCGKHVFEGCSKTSDNHVGGFPINIQSTIIYIIQIY